MINTFYQALKIDLYYSVNSFLFSLKRLPIFKDLITNDIYKSKGIKAVVGFIGSIISIIRASFFKYLYYAFIYYLCSSLFKETNLSNSYYHVLFFLTLLGLFINNKLLNSSKKKYFSLILFQMDGKKFFQTTFIWNLLTRCILNGIFLYIYVFSVKGGFYEFIILLIMTVSFRVVGEYLNILFYRKYHYIWYSNTILYYPILLVLFGCSFLPYIHIVIPFSIITLITVIIGIISIYAFYYLMRVDDYTYLFKQLYTQTQIMNSNEQGSYLRQSMIDVKEKDKEIDTSILKNKHGYDLFNTIFFERHKEILLRSAKKYAFFLIVFYSVASYLMIHYSDYNVFFSSFLHYKLAFFVLIMFYLNRGSIITRAMFFNCDHAMLRFNFYREPKVLLELFKKRLITVVKVNLIPAVVVGIGNGVLLVLSSLWSIPMIITNFLFIILLSVFFSVHYLVIYYLLQPYNKDMEVKKIGYSIILIGTYIVCFLLKDIVLSSLYLSIIGIVFVVIYILVALKLVYKIAPETFKLY